MISKEKSQGTPRNEFLSIASAIRERIRSGEVGFGRIMPTERELQEEFSVSRSTVRRALKRLEDEGWVQKVRNRGAMASSGLVRSRTMNIGLIDGDSYVLRVLTHRFSEMLREYGYHLVHLGGSNQVTIEERIQYAFDNSFDGLMVWPYRGFTDEEALAKLTSQIPVVALDHFLPGGKGDLVTFDYEAAAEVATAHLISQGCRKIGLTGMLDMLDVTHLRLRGYFKAMFANGLQPNSGDFLFTNTSGMSAAETGNLTRRLKDADRPDGFLVLQDMFMPSTIEAILGSGLKVPQDVKLATIGDEIDVAIEGVCMTTVALDWDSMVQNAVQLLLDRIENPIRAHRTVQVPHSLIVRGTCGAPKEVWTPNPESLTGFHGNFPFPRSSYQFSSSWTTS